MKSRIFRQYLNCQIQKKFLKVFQKYYLFKFLKSLSYFFQWLLWLKCDPTHSPSYLGYTCYQLQGSIFWHRQLMFHLTSSKIDISGLNYNVVRFRTGRRPCKEPYGVNLYQEIPTRSWKSSEISAVYDSDQALEFISISILQYIF